MAISEVQGDLFQADVGAIGHGCNCEGVMGAGIALQFRRRYPEMFREYRRLCVDGEFQIGSFFVWEAPGRTIYNLATQPTRGPTAAIAAIRTSVEGSLRDASSRGLKALGLPRIGTGLGGLAWEDVSQVLSEVASSSPVDLIVVTLPSQATA